MVAHVPILVEEVLNFLQPHNQQTIIDVTAGGGGHLKAVKERCPTCQIVAVDQDEDAITALEQRFGDSVIAAHDNFRNIVLVLKRLGIEEIDALIADLGVSTHQLETGPRGFSFNIDAPLDMRMDQRQSLTAQAIVNRWPQEKIRDALRVGEEPFANRIASSIVATRQHAPITTTDQLVEVIRRATPPRYRHSRAKIHFATNTFRALRLAVNDELGALQSLLTQIPRVLKPEGKVAIITFHSLEDRLVKQAMQSWQGKMITCKPSVEEIQKNPKARSARLRAFQMVPPNQPENRLI